MFFQSLLVILVLILVGIFCEKKKLFNNVQIEGFEIFLLKIAIPCYLFISTLEVDLNTLLNIRYIASFLIVFLIIIGIIKCCYFKAADNVCMKMLIGGYVNTSMYAMPIISFLFGNPIAGVLANLLQVIIIQSTFITILSFLYHKEKSLQKKLFTGICHPLVIMPILGLICNYWQFNVPPFIFTPIQKLGQGAVTLGLFTFGLAMSTIKLHKKSIDFNIIKLIFIKNILHPLIAFIIGKYVFSLEYYWLCSLIIVASAPPAFIVYILAKQFATEYNTAKIVIGISSIVSLIVLVMLCVFIT